MCRCNLYNIRKRKGTELGMSMLQGLSSIMLKPQEPRLLITYERPTTQRVSSQLPDKIVYSLCVIFTCGWPEDTSITQWVLTTDLSLKSACTFEINKKCTTCRSTT